MMLRAKKCDNSGSGSGASHVAALRRVGERGVGEPWRFVGFAPKVGFTSVELSQSDAVADTFIQRHATAHLPPLWGWITLDWIRRKVYLSMKEDWRETLPIDPMALP